MLFRSSKDQWETAKRQGETPAAKKAIEFTFVKTEKAPALAAPAPEIEEPKKRPEKKTEAPTPKKDLESIMSGWSQEKA